MRAYAAISDSDPASQALNSAISQVLGKNDDARRRTAANIYRARNFTPATYLAETQEILAACTGSRSDGVRIASWYDRMGIWAARRLTAIVPYSVARSLWFGEGAPLASTECFRLKRNVLLATSFVVAVSGEHEKALHLVSLERRCDRNNEPGAFERHRQKRRAAKNQSAKSVRAKRRLEAMAAKKTINMVPQCVEGATGRPKTTPAGHSEKTRTQVKDLKTIVVQDKDPEASDFLEAMQDSPLWADLPADVRQRYEQGIFDPTDEAASAAGCDLDIDLSDENDTHTEPCSKANEAALRSLSLSEAARDEIAADDEATDKALWACLDEARKPLYPQSKAGYAHISQKLQHAIETLMALGRGQDIHDAALRRQIDIDRLFDACHEPRAQVADLKRVMLQFPHARGLYMQPALALGVSRTFWLYEAERMVADGAARNKNAVRLLYCRVRARAKALRDGA